MQFRNDANTSSNWRWSRVKIAAVVATLLYFWLRPSLQRVPGSVHKIYNASSSLPRSVRFEQVPVDAIGVLRYVAIDADTEKEISMEDWIRIVSDSGSFDMARTLTTILKDAPYKAYQFETPGVSHTTVSATRFEFVLVDDGSLERFASTPDPDTFAAHLNCGDQSDNPQHDHPPAGCVFQNLSGDAILVAPRDWSPESSPSKYSSCYGHLANFVRGAPEQQVLELWNTVGKVLKEKILTSASKPSSSIKTINPLWFSTAGQGVAYLHFRLDSRPKYYRYKPFKVFQS